MIWFSLKRISTVGPRSRPGGVGSGYLRPDQFLDHLTVIKGGDGWKKVPLEGGRDPLPPLMALF